MSLSQVLLSTAGQLDERRLLHVSFAEGSNPGLQLFGGYQRFFTKQCVFFKHFILYKTLFCKYVPCNIKVIENCEVKVDLLWTQPVATDQNIKLKLLCINSYLLIHRTTY